ncbi:hypothetical protein JRQ81_007156 [Phrynocephalus forsythii]|uniref:NHS-like protein 2 n=1 Tax=Phrynocephalus forsythii TaxID=171643 RepID=A0A9Q0XDL9_9SAUR|nr:hypothetical protein JRQ81_007156 [Phrynocephalus forsythii]
MPFWKRTVEPRRLLLPSAAEDPRLAALPLAQLHDVCGRATLALLRQLADLCGHSAALLADLEGRLAELARRAHRLRGRLGRLRGRLRPGASPAAAASSTLDPEVKKPTPPKLLWHQPTNIFLVQPVGVEELHHEAELNLQSLLQEEYEEPYSDARVSGQTFRYASPVSPDRPLGCGPRPPSAKRLEFVFMPSIQQVNENETTTLGVRAVEPSLSLPATPDRNTAWAHASILPSLDEKQAHHPCSTQANIVPINVSGQPFARHASARHSLFNTETAMNPKSLLRRRRTVIGFPHLSLRDQGNSNGPVLNPPATVAESVSCHFISDVANGKGPAHQTRSPHPRPQLRKTFSDLGGVLQGRRCLGPTGHPENSRAVYTTSPPCNGPKEDGSFSPAWSASSFGYASPAASQGELSGESKAPWPPRSPRGTPDSERPASFFIDKEQPVGSNGSGAFCASPTEAEEGPKGGTREGKASLASVDTGEGDGPPTEKDRAACRFRERSLSVPTDTVSLCSIDMGGSKTCGLSYPSASSEGSTSTDNISVAVEQGGRAKLRRQRTKSISLKKARKKPCPPVRSVSLIKEEPGAYSEPSSHGASQEQRPKSLCLLPEAQAQSQDHGDAPPELEGVPYAQQWYMPEWPPSNPYCSLSGSSTATGPTVIEQSKAPRGSSESLPSPSVSRATTPSQLSAEACSKTASPGRPTGVMSPSSGYSSQSETPTPTVPTSAVLGHVPHQTARPRPWCRSASPPCLPSRPWSAAPSPGSPSTCPSSPRLTWTSRA